jgi:hypothetical protein
VSVQVTRDYSVEKVGEGDTSEQAEAFASATATGGRVVSAFVRATKPASG